MPPSIWPSTLSGLSARPTSCAVAIWTTLTSPSSGSTSTTARWATNANAVWQLPCPFSSRSSVGAVVVLERLVEVETGGGVGDGDAQVAHRVDDVAPVDREPQRVDAVRSADVLEQPLAHQPARAVDGAAAHPRLARRRRRPCRADAGVDRLEHHVVDAEHRPGDLAGDRDEPLTDLGGGELQRGRRRRRGGSEPSSSRRSPPSTSGS